MISKDKTWAETLFPSKEKVQVKRDLEAPQPADCPNKTKGECGSDVGVEEKASGSGVQESGEFGRPERSLPTLGKLLRGRC